MSPIAAFIYKKVENELDSVGRRTLAEEGPRILDASLAALAVPTISVTGRKTWPAFQRKDFISGVAFKEPYRALHAIFATEIGPGDDSLMDRYLFDVLKELRTDQRGVRYNRSEGFACWHRLYSPSPEDSLAALEWIEGKVNEIVAAWNDEAQNLNAACRKMGKEYLDSLVEEYNVYFGPIESAVALPATKAVRRESDGMLRGGALVLGRRVYGVESYLWNDIPSDLVLIDYEAIVLDLTTLGETGDTEDERIPTTSQVSALLFASAPKVIFAIGDPRRLETSLDDTASRPATWWLAAYPSAITESSGKLTRLDARFEGYFEFVKRTHFSFDLSSDWCSDHSRPAELVNRRANQVRVRADALAVNGAGNPVALCIQIAVGNLQDSRQVGRKLFAGGFTPLATSQPLYWLPPAAKTVMSEAVLCLVDAWSTGRVACGYDTELGAGAAEVQQALRDVQQHPDVERHALPLAPAGAQQVDVLIVVALKDELDAVLLVKADAVESSWEERTDSAGLKYHVRSFQTPDGGSLTFAAARASGMGSALAASAATRLIAELRPSCIAMCGICAGRRGHVQLGDIIVADRMYKYDAGKLRAFTDKDGQRINDFLPDLDVFRLDARWKQMAEDYSRDEIVQLGSNRPFTIEEQAEWLLYRLHLCHLDPLLERPERLDDRARRCPDWAKVLATLWSKGLLVPDELKLSEKGHGVMRRSLLLYPDGVPPRPPLRLHVGPLATGESVVTDEELFTRLERFGRKLLGVDMEASAVAAVADIARIKTLVVKAVQDFADQEKDDTLRHFAAEVAAKFTVSFLCKYHSPR